VGVAWGTAIPDLICTAVIIPLYTTRVLKLSMREYIARAYVGPALAAIPTAAVGWALARVTVSPSWPLFGAEAMAMVAVFAASSYFLCLTPEQRGLANRKLMVLFHRNTVIHEA